MVRFAIAVVVGSFAGISFGAFVLEPTRLHLLCLAVGGFALWWLIYDLATENAERYLARALKEPKAAARSAWLKKAAAEATGVLQRTEGVARAQQLLTLTKVRREQGLLPEALEAVECGSDIIAQIEDFGELRIELAYLKALITHEMNYDAGAIALLEHIIAVPLHELTPASANVQLRSCELLLDLVAKVGHESDVASVTRRLELLRAGE